MSVVAAVVFVPVSASVVVVVAVVVDMASRCLRRGTGFGEGYTRSRSADGTLLMSLGLD